MILRDPVGSLWPVKVACRRDGRVVLGTGWADFLRGNCLGEGDICVFEFVREINEIHVHIFRVKDDTEELVGKSGVEDTAQLIAKSGGSIQSDRRPMTYSDRERVRQLAHSFKTRNTKFVAFWRRSHLYDLRIPKLVVRKHDLKTKGSTILHDPHGRSWPVKISQWKDGNVVLGNGWRNFSRGNHLREGDACVLEFVQGADVIKVHIFRVGETHASAANGILGKNALPAM